MTAGRSARDWMTNLPLTSQWIYGLIVAAAVLVAADDETGDLQVFGTAVVTILGVWVAHVFSEAISPPTGAVRPLRHALRGSVGLLLAAVLPLAILLLGGVGLLDEYVAYYAALIATLALLSVMGWIAFARRGSPWPIRLAGALGTALVGAVVIIVKAALH